MSWKGETGLPSFSMKMRCSRVFAAAILRVVYPEEAMLEGMDEGGGGEEGEEEGEEEKWPANCAVRE